MVRLIVLLGVCGCLVLGCGGDGDAPSDAGATVTFVRGSSSGVLTQVSDTRLELLPDDGSTLLEFAIRQTDRPRLDLFHLEEHVREEWPVIVYWEDDGGTKFATQVDDA